MLSLLAGACTADQRSDATVPPTTQVAAPTTVAPVPTTTTTAPPTTRLEEQRLWAFPGPEHYEGDVLTLQLPLGDFGTHELGPTTLTIDGETAPVRAILESDPLLGWYVVFPDAFDTAGEVGRHEVIVTAEIDGSRRRVGTGIEVLSASRRPAQESTATWDFVQTECCVLRYLTDSAAARDLDAVAELLDDKAAFVEKRFERPLPEVDITLIDVLWGNGGYSGTEVVVSYLDRDFGPRDAEVVGTTLAHELTHWMTDDLEQSILPWPLEEGIAVYVTGGHFKPEDIAARTGALHALGHFVPLAEFLDDFDEMQHESRYVEAAGLVDYLVERFGWDQFIEFYSSTVRARSNSLWFDRAAQVTFGSGIAELSTGFAEWAAGQDPEPELDDLRLTIALQEARRAFQVSFAPYQNYFVFDSVRSAGQPAVALREARDPGNVAAEALIGWAQKLMAERRSAEAAPVVEQIESIVETGRIDGGLGSQVLSVAERLDESGYELLEFEIRDGRAVAVATRLAPDREQFTFEMRADGSVDVDDLPDPVAIS